MTGLRLLWVTGVPRQVDDYTAAAVLARQEFVRANTDGAFDHVTRYSFDPGVLPGNIENFTGVAQVPIGVAGPLHIVGEHARGDFYVPLATTEGTLVASYNRGMRLLSACGGAKTTVLETYMQRAPVFLFGDARQGRDFGLWLEDRFEAVKGAAESTTRVGRLHHISQHAVGPLRYLRFNFTTGDAAGQNMVGRATWAACEWIRANHPDHPRYVLSGNMDTDKKHSQLNMLETRGRRVVAEVALDKDLLRDQMGVEPETLFRMRAVSATGAFLSGAASNGLQTANAIAAISVATGQDVANVAESHASMTVTDLLPTGDYYWSVTLPSLIVATCGGGTGLPTQRECLEVLGCYGSGKADKLAEIVAATLLAGEISLGCAVLRGDWVSGHERFGRNRPDAESAVERSAATTR